MEPALNECLDFDGSIRPLYRGLMDNLEKLGVEEMQRRWRQAKDWAAMDAFTFMLDPKEFRTVPTDWIPRLVPSDHWETIARGVAQRLKSINLFLADLYCGEQNIVPPDVMFSCQYYNPELQDFRPAQDVFVHIYGVDLVHMGDGRYVILEDNLRIPSGISYQMKTTEIGLEVMPELAEGYDIVPYDIKSAYQEMFLSLCDNESPVCVLLTDSKYGAAFFEHRYLSELLGVALVEGSDLYIGANGRVWAKAMGGDIEVDLIYRRVQDLDLFVPGLMDAYLNHKVVMVNAMGTGAADDKLVFLWAPDMIRAYTGEEPILEQAKSYDLRVPANRQYVLQNLDSLVLKHARDTAVWGSISCLTWEARIEAVCPSRSLNNPRGSSPRKRWTSPSTWYWMSHRASSSNVTWTCGCLPSKTVTARSPCFREVSRGSRSLPVGSPTTLQGGHASRVG